MRDQNATLIDASLRFARSNPQLLAYARAHARLTSRTVDDLLAEAISRVAAGREREERRQTG